MGGNGSGVEIVIGASSGISLRFFLFSVSRNRVSRSECRRRDESVGWQKSSRVLSLKGELSRSRDGKRPETFFFSIVEDG